MKVIDKRLRKLEDQLGTADRPLPRSRLVIKVLGSKLTLEDARCTRMLCSNGSLMELVDFQKHTEGTDEITDEELERWIESFPIQ